MDPNKTLEEIQRALDANEDPRDHCEHLNTWLCMEGFEPIWEKYPKATEYFKRSW